MALDGNRSTVITADQFAWERFRYSLKGPSSNLILKPHTPVSGPDRV